MFVRQDVQSPEVCPWRIQTEGMPILESWVGDDRVIRLNSRKTFRKLLLEMFPKVSAGGWMELGEIGEVARNLSMGCCVLRIEKGEGEDAFRQDTISFTLFLLKSRNSLVANAYLLFL
jgi:multisite-specific tRNA:(cytosine-C5)-methyltransferase